MKYWLLIGIALTVIFSPVASRDGSARQFYDEALQAKKSGDSIKAQDLAREALNRNKDFVPALLLMTELLTSSGQLNLAHEMAKRALTLENDSFDANFFCAKIQYSLRDATLLEACLAKAEKLRVNSPDTQALRAQMLIDNAQFQVARRRIVAILREHPQHLETRLALAGLYLKLKQFEKAEAEFRQIQNLLPGNSELSVAIARARLNGFFQSLGVTGDFASTNESAEKALDSLRLAYSNNPENLSANLMLAQLYAVTGRCSEAAEHLKKLKGTDSTESRQIVIFYGFCASTMPDALELVQNYLRRHEDDDLTRHQAEILWLSREKRRESSAISAAARYHRKLARRHEDQNTDLAMLGELRWATFLVPGYIEAHRDLARYLKATHDMERLGEELVFLRDRTNDQSYREMVEQFEIEKRDLWYVREGTENPSRAKNSIPIHIYPFTPRDPLVDHPLGGQALADRTRALLEEFGRVRSISREMTVLPQAQKFNSANLRLLRQTYQDALAREENSMPFVRQPLKLVMVGRYAEHPHGLEVSAELIDAESGIRISTIEFRSRGMGYLNQAALRLAEFVFREAPLSAQIFKLVGDDRVLINVGKRDNISKKAEFSAADKLGRTITFNVEKRDFDIILAKSEQIDANRHLKAGDLVQSKQKKD